MDRFPTRDEDAVGGNLGLSFFIDDADDQTLIHCIAAQCHSEGLDTPSAHRGRTAATFPEVSGGVRISYVAPAVAPKYAR